MPNTQRPALPVIRSRTAKGGARRVRRSRRYCKTSGSQINVTHHPLLQPIMLAGQGVLCQPITLAVRIVTEAMEVPSDAQAGGSTEIIDQCEQFICIRAATDQSIGSGAGGCACENFPANVNRTGPPNPAASALRALN